MVTCVLASEFIDVDDALARLHASLRHLAALPASPALLSACVALPALDPLDYLMRGESPAWERLYWERPADGEAVLGVGAAWSVEDDTTGAARAWATLLDGAAIDAESAVAGARLGGPLLLGGFAFDPSQPVTPLWAGFSAGRLTLPAVSLCTAGAVAALTANLACSPGLMTAGDLDRAIDAVVQQAAALLDGSAAGPRAARTYDGGEGQRPVQALVKIDDGVGSRVEWELLVAEGARVCREGNLEKVVLARTVRARTPGGEPFDLARVLRRLRDSYPNAYIFAVGGRGLDGEGTTFVGATPERLVRLADGIVDVACLAGTASRGATPQDDAMRGEALLHSTKDLAEHAVVVEAVRAALCDLCDGLDVPAAPRLLRLPNVQHLYTPVTGRVHPHVGTLDLVRRLHPTPAVGGQPRRDALAFIREHEGLDRGWYAAPVGWLDRHGEGEFAVALRSGLLHAGDATLFAGCGIVAGSDPAAEYVETRLKLRPMLDALGTGA